MDPALEATVATLRRALGEGPPVRLAILFGSLARGRAHAGSDADVAILFGRDVTLAEELSLQAELTRAVGREVDLVRLDVADTLVRWEVARHGLPIVANPPEELPRFLALAACEHADFAPALEDAARRYARRVAGEGR